MSPDDEADNWAALIDDASDQAADGASILDELRRDLARFVALPSEHAADAVVLWIATTHVLQAFDYATRLVIRSPEKQCGKSRLLEIISDTCRRPVLTGNATAAALYRSIGDDPPTLLLDEADTIFGTKMQAERNEDLRGLFNAGFRRGLPVLRTVGPSHEVREFSTFAMAALAGIGTLPDTIEDRAIIVEMRRRGPGEVVQPYRLNRDRPIFLALGARLAAWAETVVTELRAADPELPLEDRAADTWAPVVATADAAGGTWPTRARAAAVVMAAASASDGARRSNGVRLLADVRGIFTAAGYLFMPSAMLADRLTASDDDEAPWHEAGRELTPRRLAMMLAPYGVKPRPDPERKLRGYYRADFADAFARYLPPPGESGQTGTAPDGPLDEPETLL